MVERSLCMREATGSNPVISTFSLSTCKNSMLWVKWLDVLRRARIPEARAAVAYFLEDLAKEEGFQQNQKERLKVSDNEIAVLQRL